MSVQRPAFYARTGTRRGDWVALLHPPYTAWNLSYVVIGACLADELSPLRLGLTVLAFFLGTGVASHALDELNGRPLKTSLSDRELIALATAGLGGAALVAIISVWIISPWVLAVAALGCGWVLAYTLEWWHGRFHTDLGFALSWGAFPVLVGFWAQSETLSAASLIAAGAAALLSLAQRDLSTPARFVRRRTSRGAARFDTVEGAAEWDLDELLRTWERPLKWISWAVVCFSLSLLAARF